MELKVGRIIALDEALLRIERNKIVGRRSSIETIIQQPKKIRTRRNTTVDQVENAARPKSILWNSKFKNIPFSRVGRRRKSVTFSPFDDEENSTYPIEEDTIAKVEANNNDSVAADQPLIQFDDSDISDLENVPNVVSTGILEAIGFDGPSGNNCSSSVLAPNVRTPTMAQFNDSTDENQLFGNSNIQIKCYRGKVKRPIPALIALNPKRRSIAASIVISICNDSKLVSPIDGEAIIEKPDFDVPNFGILRYED